MRWLAALILRLLGWQTVYTPAPGPKSVVAVYPHTSNWDFPLGVLFKSKHRMAIKWAGKDSLFRGPMKPLFLWLGGVPINRRERTGMIAQLSAAFSRSERLCVCIAPEGTRAHTDHWKTGFYRLALAAQVPLGLAFIDYGKKRIGVERWIELSGDEAADLALLRAYYADMVGRHPQNAGEIRFKAQSEGRSTTM